MELNMNFPIFEITKPVRLNKNNLNKPDFFNLEPKIVKKIE